MTFPIFNILKRGGETEGVPVLGSGQVIALKSMSTQYPYFASLTTYCFFDFELEDWTASNRIVLGGAKPHTSPATRCHWVIYTSGTNGTLVMRRAVTYNSEATTTLPFKLKRNRIRGYWKKSGSAANYTLEIHFDGLGNIIIPTLVYNSQNGGNGQDWVFGQRDTVFANNSITLDTTFNSFRGKINEMYAYGDYQKTTAKQIDWQWFGTGATIPSIPAVYTGANDPFEQIAGTPFVREEPSEAITYDNLSGMNHWFVWIRRKDTLNWRDYRNNVPLCSSRSSITRVTTGGDYCFTKNGGTLSSFSKNSSYLTIGNNWTFIFRMQHPTGENAQRMLSGSAAAFTSAEVSGVATRLSLGTGEFKFYSDGLRINTTIPGVTFDEWYNVAFIKRTGTFTVIIDGEIKLDNLAFAGDRGDPNSSLIAKLWGVSPFSGYGGLSKINISDSLTWRNTAISDERAQLITKWQLPSFRG